MCDGLLPWKIWECQGPNTSLLLVRATDVFWQGDVNLKRGLMFATLFVTRKNEKRIFAGTFSVRSCPCCALKNKILKRL